MRALIMVGGQGQRLYPYTAHLPKPLMPIGDKPILEYIIRRLCHHGIRDITLAVSHMASLIQAYCGDGARFGAAITYLHESRPLGTAGAIGLLPEPRGTLLVTNGDILSNLDLDAMAGEHRSSGAMITVASKMQVTDISSGVLDTDADGFVTDYREKPQLRHRIGIGTYLLEPAAQALLAAGEPAHMPDLILRALRAGQRVASYDHGGDWIDIGRPEDYARAQADMHRYLVGGPDPDAAAPVLALGAAR